VVADPLGEAEPEESAGREGAPSHEREIALPGERALVPSDPFRRYVAELRKYPLLTREDEQELARRYRSSGDREALFRLVTSNLMLVVRIAHSFRRAAHNLLELIQEGNLGLLQAIERFDPELGVRLPTYAAWWVRAYIVKFLLDNVRLVRVGTTNARRKLLYNLRKEQARLESLGFEVGPRMLADHFGVSEEDVRDVQKALASKDVSLDAPVGGEDERSRSETMAAVQPTVEEQVARRELQERVQATLARFRETLGDREKTILDLRVLSDDPLTLQELGNRFGTTREAVRQQEARLMTRLREFVREELGDLAGVRIGPA
jgi:RNA polymerase sigma-32 factor